MPSSCTFGSFRTELDVEEEVVLIDYVVTDFLLFQCNFNKFLGVDHQFARIKIIVIKVRKHTSHAQIIARCVFIPPARRVASDL